MRPWTAPRALLAATAALAAAALGASLDLAARPARQRDRSVAFQRLVGGLGSGPALDFTSCPAELDPRLAGRCPERHQPVPGGDLLCPWLGRSGGDEPAGDPAGPGSTHADR